MRLPTDFFLLAALLTIGCHRTHPPAAIDTTDNQKIVKEVSTNNGAVLTRTAIASGPNPAADFESIRNGEKTQATFSGGSGSSIKDAVVITATNEVAGYRAAYIWLHEYYPGSHLQDEGSDHDDNGRFYTEEKIATADGKSITVFFETTSFFGQ